MSIFSLSDQPLNISLLVLPDCSMMSVACTLDPMRAANRIADNTLFNWEILTLDGQPVPLTCGLPIMPDNKFGETPALDVLIIIAGFNSDKHFNKSQITNLARLARQYTAVGGIEAGSLIMAKAGLLNHRRATTHWEDLEDFAAGFPDVEVLPDRFVIDGRYFTTGGASPAFDLMLHLIRTRQGVAFAMEVASVFIYDDVHSASDAQSFVSLGRLKTCSPKLAKAINLMEDHLDEPLQIAEIAARGNISVRSLETMFQSALATSPGKYYRHIRLQQARRLLTDTELALREIAIRTGFNSSSAFSRAMQSHFNKPPGQFRQ